MAGVLKVTAQVSSWMESEIYSCINIWLRRYTCENDLQMGQWRMGWILPGMFLTLLNMKKTK